MMDKKQLREIAMAYLAWCITLRKDFETGEFHTQFEEYAEDMRFESWAESEIDAVLHQYYAYVIPVFRKRMARGEGMGSAFGCLVVEAAERHYSTEFED